MRRCDRATTSQLEHELEHRRRSLRTEPFRSTVARGTRSATHVCMHLYTRNTLAIRSRHMLRWAGTGALSLSALSGCAVIEGIFKAGVWVGVLGVMGVVGLVIWGLTAAFR